MIPKSGAHRPRRNFLCLVTDAYGGRGGIALYNRDVIEALCNDPATESVVAIPRVMNAPPENLPEKLLFDTSGLGSGMRFLQAVYRQLRSRQKFDVIYCAHINLVPVARVAAWLAGVPWILCIYGFEAWDPPPRFFARRWAAQADFVISISKVTLERFRGWAAVSDTKCALVPNAIDLSRYALLPKDSELLDRYGLAGRKVVMTLGRLDESEQAKGFDRVIEILPRLKEVHPDIAYLIVGDGGDQPRLESLAEKLKIRDSVVFAGFVSEEDKTGHYALADAYVMPSKFEGFGFVFLEAMACGLPVVASSIDGGRDALREGALGRLVDPFDAGALLAATLAALEESKHIPEAINYFSVANFGERLLSAVGKLFRN